MGSESNRNRSWKPYFLLTEHNHLEFDLLIMECLNRDKKKFLPGSPIRFRQSVNKQTQRESGESSHEGRRTNFRKIYFQKTNIHRTAKLQALGVLVLICFQEIPNSGTTKTLPGRETLRSEGIRGNTAQSTKTDLGKLPYVPHFSNVLKHSTSPMS